MAVFIPQTVISGARAAAKHHDKEIYIVRDPASHREYDLAFETELYTFFNGCNPLAVVWPDGEVER